jgi:hypothetical protein
MQIEILLRDYWLTGLWFEVNSLSVQPNQGVTSMSQIVGKIGRHNSRPERLAIIRPDGTPAMWFDMDQTEEELRAEIIRHGYAVAVDGTVTRP